jgi:hypothetical protein
MHLQAPQAAILSLAFFPGAFIVEAPPLAFQKAQTLDAAFRKRTDLRQLF